MSATEPFIRHTLEEHFNEYDEVEVRWPVGALTLEDAAIDRTVDVMITNRYVHLVEIENDLKVIFAVSGYKVRVGISTAGRTWSFHISWKEFVCRTM